MKYILLSAFLTSCVYAYSARDSIPSQTAYCEPINQDVQLCREDNGLTYRCVNSVGYWQCEVVHA